MKFSICIVLYNPTEKDILQIRRYSEMNIFEKIFIFDNSSTILQDMHLPHTEYIFLNGNYGLSIPYNKLIEKEIDRRDFLCIMDQDSIFDYENISILIKYIENNANDLSNVAIIGPEILKSNNNNNQFEQLPYCHEVAWTINSGSFLNLKVFSSYGLRYDEKIFLDGVDYEMGLQCKKHNLKVIVLSESKLIQNFGYSSKNNAKFQKYAPFRYYLISKNRKYIYTKHYGIMGLVFAQLKNFNLLFKIIRYEDSKFEKIKSCVKGILSKI